MQIGIVFKRFYSVYLKSGFAERISTSRFPKWCFKQQGLVRGSTVFMLFSVPAAIGLIWFAASTTTFSDLPQNSVWPSKEDKIISGNEVPLFKAVDLNGQERTIKDYLGKVVLINLWATWCPPCVAEIGSLQRLQQKYEAQGFTVLSVNVDAAGAEDTVNKFVAQNGITFPVLRDPKGQIPRLLKATGFPESFFVDATGKFIAVQEPEDFEKGVRIVGDRPWDAPAYLKIVEDLLKG